MKNAESDNNQIEVLAENQDKNNPKEQELSQMNPVVEEKNKSVNENTTEKKSKKTIMIVIIAILAIILIGIGAYFSYASNPKRIIASAIENLSSKLKEPIISDNEDLQIGDNYTINSDVKFNIESDYLTMLAGTDPTYLPYANILKNLNQTNNSLLLSQDKKNKKVLANWTTTLNGQELLNGKYYVENATQYFYLKNFLNTYINGGSSNYFEALEENATSAENMIYIYDVIIKSFKNNLKDEYFTKYKEKTTVNNQEKELTKVSVKITDKRLKEIAKAILKDLKEDTKANKILTGIDEAFSKSKISDDVELLGEKQSIELNVYTNNLTYEIEKYEMVFLDNTKESKITYEEAKDNAKIYITQDSQLIARLDITKQNNKYTTKIISSSEKELGNITIEKNNKGSFISANINDEELTIDLTCDSKYEDIKKNKSYTNNVNLTLKVVSNNISIVNATIKTSNKASNEVKINEDVSNSVLASSITTEQQQALQQQLTNVLLELMK